MNEIFASIKMCYALVREVRIREKLLKHQYKMIDIYNDYSKQKFNLEEVGKLREDLLKRLQAIRRENERSYNGFWRVEHEKDTE